MHVRFRIHTWQKEGEPILNSPPPPLLYLSQNLLYIHPHDDSSSKRDFLGGGRRRSVFFCNMSNIQCPISIFFQSAAAAVRVGNLRFWGLGFCVKPFLTSFLLLRDCNVSYNRCRFVTFDTALNGFEGKKNKIEN